MTTQEIANLASTKYFIEYLCENLDTAYYQIVRTADCAILYANESIDNIFVHCFHQGINREDVSLW